MEIIVQGKLINAKKNNELLEKGYIFKVVGDMQVTDSIDPWTHLPNTTENTHFFTSEVEANEYATTQFDLFTGTAPRVKKVTREETWEEYEKKVEDKKRARAKAKAEKEREKAEALGMGIEEYKAFKKIENRKKQYAREIEEMEKEIEEQ